MSSCFSLFSEGNTYVINVHFIHSEPFSKFHTSLNSFIIEKLLLELQGCCVTKLLLYGFFFLVMFG